MDGVSKLRERAVRQRSSHERERAFIPRPRKGSRATMAPPEELQPPTPSCSRFLEEFQPLPHPLGGIKIVEGGVTHPP